MNFLCMCECSSTEMPASWGANVVRRLCSMPLRPYCNPFRFCRQCASCLPSFRAHPVVHWLYFHKMTIYIRKPVMYMGPNSYRQTMLHGPSEIPYFWATINVYPCLSINLYFQISWANCDCGLIKVILLFYESKFL